MELLLDTVSNVFGGVMFLTLLAALLVINRGGAAIAEKALETESAIPSEYERQQQLLKSQREAMEIETLDFSIHQQQAMLAELNPDGDAASQAQRLAELQADVASTKRHVQNLQQQELAQTESLQEQKAALLETQSKHDQLSQAVAKSKAELNKLQAASQRSIEFRPLRRSDKREATLMLRYGRIYRLLETPESSDFYLADITVLKILGTTTVAPRRGGGQPATPDSIARTVGLLTKHFPADRFNASVAVWDDSFDKFNELKNALINANYEYRTMPSTDDTVLSMGDVRSLVQ